MAIVKIICTFVMFGILIYAIIKKYKATVVLLCLGLLAITVMNLINKTAPGTSGNFVIDLFELVKDTFTKQLSGTAFTCMSAVAYVRFMDRMKAADMFATLATKPLKNFKKPYLLIAVAMVFMCFINLFVASAAGRVALYMATIYPLMMAVGVTPATAGSAIIAIATFWCIGPTATLVITALGLADTNLTSVEQFLQYDLRVHIPVLIVIMIVFTIVNKYFDKKEAEAGIIDVGKEQKIIDPDELGIPKWFAILPALPLIFCMVFSPLLVKSVKLSVPGAVMISWFIASFCNVIAGKGGTLKERFNFAGEYINDLGDAMKQVGAMIVCASVFSTGLTAIGGMKEIVNLASAGNGGGVFVGGTVIALLYALSLAITGSANANLATYATMLAGLCSGDMFSKMLTLMMSGGNFFCGLSPVASPMIVLTGATGIDSARFIKRNIITGVACFVASTVMALIFIGA